jgi:hypothetical protein
MVVYQTRNTCQGPGGQEPAGEWNHWKWQRPKFFILGFSWTVHGSMGDLQDPKMEVRSYHIFGHILWGYSLKFRPEK